MAAQVTRHSLAQLQILAQQQQKLGTMNWSHRGNDHASCSLPRLYTCSFCHREFRSAQALGGHMNIHRRERAMLHESMHHAPDSSSSSTPPVIVVSAPEFMPRSTTAFSVEANDHRNNAALNLFPGNAGSIRGKGGVKSYVHVIGNENWNDIMEADGLDLELRL